MVYRFRTRELSGTLLQLYGIGGQRHMSIELEEGHVCLMLEWPQQRKVHLCLNKIFLNDGNWHSIEASRSVRTIV
ncbi:hypothetical protein Avbf_13154 [Armadillidium vulgare]|nr:hypothetical protein Avbf_13154 [Armadillidium vulgare]